MASDSELAELMEKLNSKTAELREAESQRDAHFRELDGLRSELSDAFERQRSALDVRNAAVRKLSATRRETEPLIRRIETAHDEALDVSDAWRVQASIARSRDNEDEANHHERRAIARLNEADNLNKRRKKLVKTILIALDAKLAAEQTFSALRTEYKLAQGRLNAKTNDHDQAEIKCRRLTRQCESLRRTYDETIADRLIITH